MTPPDESPPASAAKSLADALARKKAASQTGPSQGRGKVLNDRAAAARSAAKSKSPMRK